jgi:uncharacterized protein
MTITVFGATGLLGTQVIHQALAKKYTVKAFGRNVESLIDKDLRDDYFIAQKGYVFSEEDVFNAVKNSDAVISCLGGGEDGLDKTRSLGTKNIIAQMQKAGVKKLIAIGGIGVLNNADDSLVMDNEDFPDALRAVSQEHLAVWEQLQNTSLQYTFICPPTVLNSTKIESYKTSITYIGNNDSFAISVGSLAHCILNSLSNDIFIHQKVGISN